MEKSRFSDNRIEKGRRGALWLRRKKNAGTTLVELIVTFALLGIFLTAVTMVTSNALITYYKEQQLLSMYSVADTVFSEIRTDIRTMQPSVYPPGPSGMSVSANGFVKLRGESGPITGSSDTAITGDTIEFLKTNDQDGQILEQIDAKGCVPNTALIEAEESVKVIKKQLGNTIPSGQLTARFYLQAPESNVDLRNYFMDKKLAASSVPVGDGYGDITAGTPLVWDAEDRLPVKLYQGYTVETSFTLTPKGADLNVSSVQVTVSLYDPASPNEVVYQKSGTVPLQNTVRYRNTATLYSEVSP